MRKLTRRLGRRGRRGDHAGGDREGDARDALPRARGADRLDGGRGRRPLPVRRDAGAAGRPGAGARGAQARGAGSATRAMRCATARARSARRLRAISHDARAPHRRGDGAGARAQRARPASCSPARPREARRLAAAARQRTRPRRAGQAAGGGALEAAGRPLRAGRRADRPARCAGEKITDRLVSLADPDARPIRKGKLGKPTEFGYVAQICEVTQNTRPGRAASILPAASGRQPGREHAAAADRRRARGRSGSAARGRARRRLPARRRPATLAELERRPVFVSGRHEPGSGANAAAIAPLPNRDRGPDQPPQARLRAAPIAAEGRRGPAHLDRLGDPRLRPRHLRRPRPLKRSSRRTATANPRCPPRPSRRPAGSPRRGPTERP